MKAFLIDPKARTITEVEYNGKLQEIYNFLGCQCFTVAPINDSTDDSVYVDDEGLLSNERPLYAFQFIGGHQPLVGRGLVVGYPDDEGDTTPATITLEQLQNITHFGTLGS